jgi:hypothetical protein
MADTGFEPSNVSVRTKISALWTSTLFEAHLRAVADELDESH